MYLNFLIPNPPSFLGLLILSQLIRWSLFLPWSWPHQKARIIESILLQTCFGTLEHEKEYNGRDWRTVAIKVVLPVWDKSFIFQPWSFAFCLSIRNWKSATLLPLNLNWTPRYLLGCWTRLTWRVLARLACSFIGMFGEQNTLDLARLIDWHEMEQYHFRMSWRFWTKILSFLPWGKIWAIEENVGKEIKKLKITPKLLTCNLIFVVKNVKLWYSSNKQYPSWALWLV